MTVKTISTADAGSYTFTPPTTELFITATGSVAKGVFSTGTGTYTLVNRGEILSPGTANGYGAVNIAGNAIITNTGTIRSASAGHGAGVAARGGGLITNGSASDETALIAGEDSGVATFFPGTVRNFGTIEAGAAEGYSGVTMIGGGSLTNGSSGDHAALIRGYIGADLGASAKVTNFGTIEGAASGGFAYGILMNGGTLIEEAGSLIEGAIGLSLKGATASVFGRIDGKDAVEMSGASRLNLEAGSTISGLVIVNGTSVLDVVSGTATVSGVLTNRAIVGAGTLDVSTGDLNSGAALDCAAVHQTASAGKLGVYADITDSHLWSQDAGATLFVQTGDKMSFTAVGDSFAGTVGGGGTLGLNAGYDRLSGVTLSVANTSIGATTTVAMSGAIDITGAVTSAAHAVRIEATGVTLTGGGIVTLTGASEFYGFSSVPGFTNRDTIRGGGQLGNGSLKIDNAGTIEGDSATTMDVAGYGTLVNTGLIEAVGAGHDLTIVGAVTNTGTLASDGGTLTVGGAVKGAGAIRVTGGRVQIGGTTAEAVVFVGSGALALSDSVGFTGHVSGFSHTGTTSFDLRDIAFSGAKASYSGTATAGTLTVTSGAHVAHLHLTGDYLTATWTLSNDGSGGCVVVDPTAPGAQALRIATASAGFGGGGGAGELFFAGSQAHPPPLLAASELRSA